MKIHLLGSGSSGNCALIVASSQNSSTKICLDAGIPLKTARLYSEQTGHSLNELNGVLLTHHHSDHSANIISMAANAKAPLYLSEKIINNSAKLPQSEITRRKVTTHPLEDKKSFKIGAVKITPHQVPHDAIPTFGFVFEHMDYKAGFFTDFGSPESLITENIFFDLDELIIESNYDEDMLKNGSYPQRLKDRISGPLGHLSNKQTAEIIEKGVSSKIRKITLAHISQKNNTAEKALNSAEKAAEKAGLQNLTINVAAQRGVKPKITSTR